MFSRTKVEREEKLVPQPVERPPRGWNDYLGWRVEKLRLQFEELRTEAAFEEWRTWDDIYRKKSWAHGVLEIDTLDGERLSALDSWVFVLGEIIGGRKEVSEDEVLRKIFNKPVTSQERQRLEKCFARLGFEKTIESYYGPILWRKSEK